MSSLGRLFDFAKIATVDIRENFTTQALAEAIRHDGRPIVVALARAGVLGIDTATEWRVEAITQWSFPDTVVDSSIPKDEDNAVLSSPSYRYVDLVLLLVSKQRSCEVWIEVKTASGIHGDQLERYRAYIDDHQREMERELVLLAPEPLKTDVSLVQMRWQDVADAIHRSATKRDWWCDLVIYLEEIRMTEQWTLPVSPREALALEDAHHLFRKAYSVMQEVNQMIRDGAQTPAGDSFPEWFPWPAGWVLRTCQTQFADRGRVMLSITADRPFSIFYGYAPMGGEAFMAVWIEADPRNTTARQTVRDWAARLLPHWQMSGDGWQIVQQVRRAILVDSHDDAVAWFLAYLGEILDAGLYRDVFPGRKSEAAAEPSEGIVET